MIEVTRKTAANPEKKRKEKKREEKKRNLPRLFADVFKGAARMEHGRRRARDSSGAENLIFGIERVEKTGNSCGFCS